MSIFILSQIINIVIIIIPDKMVNIKAESSFKLITKNKINKS